ncbi:GNAT family N-acetyltransferase [Enterococcus sp. LJL98]
MKIRQETPKDYEEVYEVVKKAFEVADLADGNEQDIVVKLRQGESFIPELSLVAEEEGKVVGHILFTKGKVGTQEVLALAPLAILPEYQRKGIGGQLIEAGHRIGKTLGYSFSIVLGSEVYYPRFGYSPAIEFGVHVPEGIPSMNFMGRSLDGKSLELEGPMIYAKEFGMK